MYKQNEIVIADCLRKLVTSIKGTVNHSKFEVINRNVWGKEISRHIALEITIEEDAMQELLAIPLNDSPATTDEPFNQLPQ